MYLERPEASISGEVYDIVKNCWHPIAQKRPHISELATELQAIFDRIKGSVYAQQGSPLVGYTEGNRKRRPSETTQKHKTLKHGTYRQSRLRKPTEYRRLCLRCTCKPSTDAAESQLCKTKGRLVAGADGNTYTNVDLEEVLIGPDNMTKVISKNG
ncbi:hypothetical protein SARC_11035 [Sphaeroforma arctica JP610]|uniref:Uncharacterized protein n=1 Tax=Sphaeroforma arctica JP610 TaxID=667725 RepID=A0A0L0FI53_9EUKA|nr:hypothetical protein SARC_11035 [Sphaeroforma arctica JP610]KNC76467.1 hypothetical protein SARC_11035 [Sphaeroforma arctica JP610]|eukprot:XP_014150369.1 hypothetical protein SARC_11035 [Sphaeroforma arctica JP610]